MWLTPDRSHILPSATGTGIAEAGWECYPYIDGIYTLKDREVAGEEIDALRDAIRAGGRVAAAQCLWRWSDGWGDGDNLDIARLSRVYRPEDTRHGGFVEDWTACTHGGNHYFLVRWAAPSHLSVLALLPLLCDGKLLDIACGAGHAAGLLAAVAPKTELYLSDFNLLHAVVAKAYFAPDASVACLDFNMPLPLPDSAFDTVMIGDALAYCDRPMTLLAEAMRVLKPDGELFVVHVHDPRSLEGEQEPGEPLIRERYVERLLQADPAASVFGAAECRFLARIAAGMPPDRAMVTDLASESPGAYLLRVVKGGGRGRPCRDWRPAGERAFLNPIYRVDGRRGVAEMTWPSPEFEGEFGHTTLPRMLPLETLCTAGGYQRLVREGILIPQADDLDGGPQ